jgi:hypothetical protein
MAEIIFQALKYTAPRKNATAQVKQAATRVANFTSSFGCL